MNASSLGARVPLWRVNAGRDRVRHSATCCLAPGRVGGGSGRVGRGVGAGCLSSSAGTDTRRGMASSSPSLQPWAPAAPSQPHRGRHMGCGAVATLEGAGTGRTQKSGPVFSWFPFSAGGAVPCWLDRRHRNQPHGLHQGGGIRTSRRKRPREGCQDEFSGPQCCADRNLPNFHPLPPAHMPPWSCCPSRRVCLQCRKKAGAGLRRSARPVGWFASCSLTSQGDTKTPPRAALLCAPPKLLHSHIPPRVGTDTCFSFCHSDAQEEHLAVLIMYSLKILCIYLTERESSSRRGRSKLPAEQGA